MRPCGNCGASIEASGHGVTCPRCGAENPGVRGAAAQPVAPPIAQPATPAPGPPRAVKVILAAAMAVVGVGFAVMFFAQVDPPQEPAPRARQLSTQLDALCFVDANGDDAPDPVLWQDGKTRGRVVAVDGRSGQGIWSSQVIEKPDALACPDRGTVLAGGGEANQLHALDARSGKERWAAELPGVPDEVAGGDGCATVVMKDGTAMGISLAAGAAAECPTAPEPAAITGQFWERKKNPRVVQVGDVEVALTVQAEGPPRLIAEGRRGGASLWKKDLPARAPVSGGRPDLFLVASGGAALVLGVDVVGGTEPRLIALDPASGASRYEVPAGYLGERLAVAKAAGAYVYIISGAAVSGAALRAIDPATGGTVWRATPPP
ncbi:outer membrane protein assembly factor BamB family protein [Sorangium sp. So ce388]|uniref:outer membrane protein assembly factor BamB family protein n=1 Tax=Sorangium sp. So ce388 TaxID=3133309 RepID=UPI003F5BE843